jgi:hypothetical protein
VKGVSVPESDKIYLTAPEVQALANAPINGELGAEIRQAFLFGCYTGLRISDLKTLAWGDIQRDPLQINKRQEKTERKAFVPLHAVAWGIIDDKRLYGYKEPVFSALSKSKTNTNEYLKRWAKKAGIEKNIGWHTFAVLSLESGTEIYTLSKLLGHTDVKTTQVYANATDKMKREAVNALPVIDIGRGEMKLTDEQLEIIKVFSREIEFGRIIVSFTGPPSNVTDIIAEKHIRFHHKKTAEPVRGNQQGQNKAAGIKALMAAVIDRAMGDLKGLPAGHAARHPGRAWRLPKRYALIPRGVRGYGFGR